MPGQSHISKVEAEGNYERLHGRLAAAREQLETLGVKVSPSSRFAGYQRVIERLKGIASKQLDLSSTDRELVHAAILECEQFVWSVEVLARPPETPRWEKIAAKVLGGQTSSQLEGKDTPARNAQFELLLASTLKQAGFVVHLQEPDIIFELKDDTPLSIAAKRVKSASKLMRRIRDGSDQIRRSRVPGLIAVQLAFLAPSSVAARNLGEAMEQLRIEIGDFAARNKWKIRDSVDINWTFGLILFSSRLVRLTSTPRLSIAFSFYLANLCSESDCRCSFLDSLRKGLESSSRTWLEDR